MDGEDEVDEGDLGDVSEEKWLGESGGVEYLGFLFASGKESCFEKGDDEDVEEDEKEDDEGDENAAAEE